MIPKMKKDSIHAKYHLEQIPISKIITNENFAIRTFYDENAEKELTGSVSRLGILQLPIVRLTKDGKKYELIIGSRRIQAAKKGRRGVIEVRIVNVNDEIALEMALSENLHRSDLTPFEEANAILKLIKKHGKSVEEVVKITKRDIGFVTRRLKLLSLPGEIQELVACRKLNMSHVELLAVLKSPEEQEELAKLIIDDNLSGGESAMLIQERNDKLLEGFGNEDDNEENDNEKHTLSSRKKRAPNVLQLNMFNSQKVALRIKITIKFMQTVVNHVLKNIPKNDLNQIGLVRNALEELINEAQKHHDVAEKMLGNQVVRRREKT